MNAKKSEITRGLKVLKLKPDGKAENKKDWETIV